VCVKAGKEWGEGKKTKEIEKSAGLDFTHQFLCRKVTPLPSKGVHNVIEK
jgi:hypothetical protein